jgi:hypothetical protein
MTEPNPFDEGTVAVDEVDTPTEALDDEVDEVAADASATDKPAKAAKEPKRKPTPDGYIMPVAFAKELTKHLEAKGASNKHGKIRVATEGDAGNPIPPQYIYSMINQANKPGAKIPLPVYTVDGQPNLLKLEEALAWWDAKDERIKAREVAKVDKEAKKAAKSTEAATEDAEPVEEAE